MENDVEPGIGHNRGPQRDSGWSWRRHRWVRARADLVGARLPIEVLRGRVKRARELGLAYPAYASVLLGSGRDILGFLYTCDALGLRLRRRLEMPAPVRDALAALVRCDRLVVAPEAEEPDAFRMELQEVSGLAFAAATHAPRPHHSWAEAREALREVLNPIKLPPGALVLVGTTPAEAAWAEATNMARFLPPEACLHPG